LVSDSEESGGQYGSTANDKKIAFLSTITADYHATDSKKTMEQSCDDSTKERIDEVIGFASWYRSLNGKDDYEQALIEAGLISAPEEFDEEELKRRHMMFCLRFDEGLPSDEDYQRMKFYDRVWAFQRGKSFFMTNKGWMGTVEGLPTEGNVVALISGLPMLAVLSRDRGNYCLVGCAYVHGLMNGEGWPNSLDELELITII
jgi:hypothetical protein